MRALLVMVNLVLLAVIIKLYVTVKNVNRPLNVTDQSLLQTNKSFIGKIAIH